MIQPNRSPIRTRKIISPLTKEIGRKLKDLRSQKGLTIRQLGELIGVSNAHICLLEQGKSCPSVDVIWKFAKYFGVDANYFFPGEKN